MPHRRHHIDHISGLQRVVRPSRKQAAGRALDCDAQLSISNGGTYRVRAPRILAIDLGTQREMLALCESERFLQSIGNSKPHRNRVARLALYLRHRQMMELAHSRWATTERPTVQQASARRLFSRKPVVS